MLGFIGAGVVGTALSLALSERGHRVVAVASRSRASAEALAARLPGCQVETPQGVADRADLVLLTTPDDALRSVAAAVVWRPGQRVVHTSGADSTDVLEPARAAGSLVGGFHPLQTFASPEAALSTLPGTTFAVEADEPLAAELESLAADLGGRTFRLRAEDKVLYHAAAAIASNYLVVLVKLSTDLWAELGLGPDEAIAALLPLLRGTLANLDRVGLPRALTGPIARGDIGTVRRHLESLAQRAPEVLPAYCLLGREALPIALAKGTLRPERAAELASLLTSGAASAVGSKPEGEAKCE